MGAQFGKYRIERYKRDNSGLPGLSDTNNFEVIKEKYNAKIKTRPSFVKDGSGGPQYVDKRKMYGDKSFVDIRQDDRVYLESSYDPVTNTFNQGYKVMDDPIIGLKYVVFLIEAI